jgi:hypothetical protein
MKAVVVLGLSLALLATQAQDRRQPGNPLDHLPPNVEMLTHFGERADVSPDNQRVAFMAKSFGDAMVVDLATRTIRCLTCNVPAAVFLRVMHLVSGDYILVGPDHFEDIRTSRARDNELWYLSKALGSRPVRFHEKMSEGVAISKMSMTVAYSQIHAQVPEIPEGASRLIVADVKIADGVATLENRRTVYESKDEGCTLEAQDFFDRDTKMTATCYEPGGLASVMVLDLATGAMTNMSKAPGTYNEVEGVFPGGQYTCVEGDRQVAELGGAHGSGNIDIWKLKLDGTGRDFVRLTRFNDYDGGKASNPVVSTDGRFLAFQAARTSDPAGVGYGILLYWFDKASKKD